MRGQGGYVYILAQLEQLDLVFGEMHFSVSMESWAWDWFEAEMGV